MPEMRFHPSGAILFHQTPQEKQVTAMKKELQKELEEIKSLKAELQKLLKEQEERSNG